MFILGIIASVALPDLSGSNSHKLDRAAEELALGLRFARDESVRTGEPHAFSLNGSDSFIEGRVIRVYKLNMTNPGIYNSASVLYHPFTKQRFNYNFYNQMDGVKITNPVRNFYYKRVGLSDYLDYRLYFDKEGKPFIYDNSFSPKYRAYKSGELVLEYNDLTKKVVLEAGGRVSIE